MSKRVGLRTMSSMGGKVPCPSGEQMADGSFETGVLPPNWTGTGVVYKTVAAHSGAYACLLEEWSSKNWIEQILDILVGCILSFGFWGLYVAGDGDVLVTVTYSDSSTTVIHFTLGGSAYIYCDIKPYLTAGKTVAKLRIEVVTVNGLDWIDDASLIGTG